MQSLCLELQLEESVDDLMQQLGADAKGHISYAQFILCHKNLQLTPGQALYQVRCCLEIQLRKMNVIPLAILGVKCPFSQGCGRR